VGGEILPQQGLDQVAAAEAVEKLCTVPLQVCIARYNVIHKVYACYIKLHPAWAGAIERYACPIQVASVSQKTVTRNPQPPYITSTLQQDASAKLGYSPSTTMQLAQQLYEGPEASGGACFPNVVSPMLQFHQVPFFKECSIFLRLSHLGDSSVSLTSAIQLLIGAADEGMITYMRTDGLQMSAEALEDIRSTVQSLHGKDYLPAQPRVYRCAVHQLSFIYHALKTPALASKVYSFCLGCA